MNYRRLYISSLLLLLMLQFPTIAMHQASAHAMSGAGALAVLQVEEEEEEEEKEADAGLSEEAINALTEQMEAYMVELGHIASSIDGANKMRVNNLSATLLALTTRYDAFLQREQGNMAGSDELMLMMAQYKVDLQAVTDSLSAQKKRVEARADMDRCEQLFQQYILRYDTLLTRATEYSLVKQTAPLLDKVKATEQMLHQDVEKYYQTAQAAAALNADLAQRMAALEHQYTDILDKSAKIQGAVYKPFIVRIQDYLKSFAYFAIIVMFFVMLQSKIAAIKSASKQAKKMKQMFDNENDYPTI